MWQLLNTNVSNPPLSRNAVTALGGPRAEPQAYNYTTPNISSYALTAQTVANLGFGSILDVKTEGDVFYYVIDVAAYTDQVSISTAPDEKTLLLTRYGIGFRVAIVAWHLKAEASANVGLVAASCQVDGGQSSLVANAFAGDIGKLGKIAEVTKFNGGKFDAAMLKNLAGFVGDLASIIATEGSKIPPVAVKYGALGPNLYSPEKAVAANHYALEQLRRGQPRNGLDGWVAAHHEWKDTLSPVIVQTSYASLGVESFSSGGSEDQRKAASDVQALGT